MAFLDKFFNKTVIIRPNFGYETEVNRSFDSENDTITTVLTCQKLIGESIAKLPINLMQLTEEGKVKAVDNPLYNILKKYPNKYLTTTTFISTLEKHRLQYGNAYAYINRDSINGKVTGFEIIHPLNIVGYKIKGNDLFYYRNDTDEALSADDVLHFKFISDDGIFGINPITALKFELDNIFQGKVTLNKSYKNNLNIDKVIESSISNFNTTAAKDSINALKEEYSGSFNSKKTPVLPAGFKLVAAPTSSIQDAQILDSINFSKNDIAALYGVPSFLIGNTGGVGVEQMTLNFKVNTLQYIIEHYQQELERKLIKDDNNLSIEFNVEALVAVDYSTKVAGVIAQKNAGLLSPNQANKILGNTSFDNGDYHYTQMQNSFPLEKLTDENLQLLMAKNTGNTKPTTEDNE